MAMWRCVCLLFLVCVTVSLLSPLILAHSHRHDHRAHASSSQLTASKQQYSTQDLVRAADIIHNMKTMDATTTPQCTACQWVWGAVVTVLGTSADFSSILSFLNGLCSILGPTYGPTCNSVAAKLVGILPEIQHQVHILNFDDPVAVCSLLSICTVTCCTDNVPQQVHIALTGNLTQMQVTWVTLTATPSSIVTYSNNSAILSSIAQGSSYTYTQGGWIGTLHTATMINLSPNTTYYYQVGDPTTGLSQIFHFHTLPSSSNTPIRYAVVGDLGLVDGTDTINDMIASAARGDYDVILHIGDISYANGYEKLWDDYFREIQPMAASIPYMVVPGNHELPYNFTSYISRFPMPGASSGSRTNLYYSMDIGSVHFIAIDTESVIDTAEITDRQLRWLQNDIARAHQRRLNGNPGWIVVYMHRPLYCTNTAAEGLDCSIMATYLRGKLESIFYDNQVDLVFAGHLHDYERTLPMYQSALDPKGPVYIINGAGGNREGVLNAYTQPAPAWSAYRVSEWGWGILTVNSPTSMQWTFHATKGDVIHDSLSFNKPS